MYGQAQVFLVTNRVLITFAASATVGFTTMMLIHSYGPTRETNAFIKALISAGLSVVCFRVADNIAEHNPIKCVVTSVGVGSFFHALTSAWPFLLTKLSGQDDAFSTATKKII